MLKKLIVVVSLILVGTQVAVAIEPNTTRYLATCEDAAHLVRYTESWRNRLTPTNDEKLFQSFVYYSPTCVWEIVTPHGTKSIGHHNRIMRVGMDGTVRQEVFVHKGGELNWLKRNYGKIRDSCWSFWGQGTVTYLRWKKDPSQMCALIKNEDGYHMGGTRNE